MKDERTLEEILQDEKEGGTGNFEEADGVIEDFYYLTMEEIICDDTKTIREIKRLMLRMGLNPERLPDMNVIDFLLMMDEYTTFETNDVNLQAKRMEIKMRIMDWFRRSVIRNRNSNEIIVDFLKINLEAYSRFHCEGITKLTQGELLTIESLIKGLGEMYDKVTGNRDECKRTIMNVWTKLSRHTERMYWRPWQSLEDYAMEIERTFEMLDETILTPLRLYYKDLCGTELLHTKYK